LASAVSDVQTGVREVGHRVGDGVEPDQAQPVAGLDELGEPAGGLTQHLDPGGAGGSRWVAHASGLVERHHHRHCRAGN
jgi:hypothetical protein